MPSFILSPNLTTLLDQAVTSGKLLAESQKNILSLLDGNTDPVALDAITELIEAKEWQELNDRFFRTIVFGTGGLRGKTISRIVTKAEQGTPAALDRPEFPCIGTNAMNYENISRASQGLANYLLKWFERERRPGQPKVALSYDTRFFSKEFAEFAARVLIDKGCDVLVFESPRSTPELSFAVRLHGADAGINVTASHNPPPYNGFKVYFADGAQVVEPHASGIIKEVNAIKNASFAPVADAHKGKYQSLGKETDDAYMERLDTLILDKELVRTQGDLRIVYTPLHGVGAVIIKPMLKRMGFQVETVAEQEIPDGRFPTVTSPNPEEKEALALAIAQADAQKADLVIATDPDDDRMGVAVRNTEGKMQLLTGNQIGSLMAWYRVTKSFALGILNKENRARAVLIKTFVTTDLQKAIAKKYEIPCVETLTGFKYIGAKLQKYELAIPEALRKNYQSLSEEETRERRLRFSTFYVFGGEESYGYSGADFVRDKDGNAAAIMFAEVAAFARSVDKTLPELLDDIYLEFGYYSELNKSLTFEGAEGAAKIQALIRSFISHPPKEVHGRPVTRVRDFSEQDITDSEGDLIPKEAMLLLELADGGKIAVRPSGTEPKIKFYLFGKGTPSSKDDLQATKKKVEDQLEQTWQWLQSDIKERV